MQYGFGKLEHPQQGKSGLTYDFFGKTDSRPLYIAQELNRVFVGSPWENDNGTIEGKVHVYDLNGQYVTTLSSGDESFGICVHANNGSKKLLVGAHLSDKVYVYDIENSYTLLGTLEADTAGTHFGWALESAYHTWAEETYDQYTQEETCTDYNVERYWVGAPQGNVVYEYFADLTVAQKLGPNDDGIWNWLYSDHSGVNGTNYVTLISEFGYSLSASVDDQNNTKYLNLIMGAPGSNTDHGAIVGIYSPQLESVSGILVYEYNLDVYYPNPADLNNSINPPYRAGEKVYLRGSRYNTAWPSQTAEYLAPLHNPAGTQSTTTDHVTTLDSTGEYIRWHDGEGNYEGVYKAYTTDRVTAGVEGQPGEGTVFISQPTHNYFGDGPRYVSKFDFNGSIPVRRAVYYNFSLWEATEVAYDVSKRLVFCASSNYCYILYDNPDAHQLILRDIFNVNPSGGGASAVSVCVDEPSSTAYVGMDEDNRKVRAVNYTDPYNPTFTELGGDSAQGLSVIIDKVSRVLYVYGTNGVYAYDVAANPTNPPQLGKFEKTDFNPTLDGIYDREHRMAIDPIRKALYVPGQHRSDTPNPDTDYNFYSLDVSDPTNISQLACVYPLNHNDLPITGRISGMAYKDDKLFFVHRGSYFLTFNDYGLFVYDVSDPSNPTEQLNDHQINTAVRTDYTDVVLYTKDKLTYGDVVLDTDNLSSPIFPSATGSQPYAKEIYSEDDVYKIRLISSPEYGDYANDEGCIEYYWYDSGDNGLIQDPFGVAANQQFGYSMTASETYLAASSGGYVVLMPHPGLNIFETYYNCDPTCALIRMYQSNSNSVYMEHVLVTDKDGIAKVYDQTMTEDDYLIVVHYAGKIKVRGTQRFYIDEYNPPDIAPDGVHPVEYDPVLIYRFDTNDDPVITDTSGNGNHNVWNPYLEWSPLPFNYAIGGSAKWLEPPRLSRAGAIDTGFDRGQVSGAYPGDFTNGNDTFIGVSAWIQVDEITEGIRVIATNMAFPASIKTDNKGSGIALWIKGENVYFGTGGGNDFIWTTGAEKLIAGKAMFVMGWVWNTQCFLFTNSTGTSTYYVGEDPDSPHPIVFGDTAVSNQFNIETQEALTAKQESWSCCFSPSGEYMIYQTLPNNYTRLNYYELVACTRINADFATGERYYDNGQSKILAHETYNDARCYITNNQKMLQCHRDGGYYEFYTIDVDGSWPTNPGDVVDLSVNQFIHVEPNLHNGTNLLIMEDLDGTEANQQITLGGVTVTPTTGWWNGTTRGFEFLDYFLIRFSGNGTRAALWSNTNGNIVILNGADNTLYQTINIGAAVTAAGYTPSAKPACMGMAGDGTLLVLDQCLLLYKDNGIAYTLDSTITPPAEFATHGFTAFNNRCAINDIGDAIIVDIFDGTEYSEFIYALDGTWKLDRVNCRYGLTMYAAFEPYHIANGTLFEYRSIQYDQSATGAEPVGRDIYITDKDRFHYTQQRTDVTTTWNSFVYYRNYLVHSSEVDVAARGMQMDDLAIWNAPLTQTDARNIFWWNDPKYEIHFEIYEDGIPVVRKVALFDKLSGAFEQFTDSSDVNPTLNKFKMESKDYALKFIIAYDPLGYMDPIGIDDIHPEILIREFEEYPVGG